MDQVQDMRKKVDLMQGGRNTKDPGTQEVLVELIETLLTYLFIQEVTFI
jgi:hypothetical protein